MIDCRGIAAAIRTVHGRKAVESGLKSKLVERNHSLDELFEIRTLEMKEKVKKDTKLNDDEVDEKGRRSVLKTGVKYNTNTTFT